MKEQMQRLYKNIKYLCKENNIKLGKFEKQCKVSAGYFSRLAGQHNDFSVSLLYKISQRFNISMNRLLEADIEKEEEIMKLELRLSELKKHSGLC